MVIKAIVAAVAIAAAAVFMSGCAEPKREIPVTELPMRPESAELPCETVTDAEMIACIKGEDTREICRKVEVNCVRYKNLQSFVKRTWTERDGK